MEEKRNKKGIIAVCLLVLSLVLIAIGTTFAFFQYSKQGTTVNKLESGTLTFIYDENRKEKNGVSLTNAFPMSDTDGVKQTGTGFFEFQVRSEARGASIYYEIYLTKDNNSTLSEYAVKTYLTEVSDTGTETGVSNLFTSEAINLYSELGESKVPSMLKQEVIGKTLYQGSVNEEEITMTFRFRMWIDNDANQVRGGEWIHNNKTFSVKVNVYAQNSSIPGPTDLTEICNDSNVNEPKLVEGMIPVYYDYEEATWKKANAKTANWYNYCNQEWANAVTVVEKTEAEAGHDREDYLKAEPGTPILIDDINTMWVWIPRYEYKYTNLGTQYAGGTAKQPGEIEINFLNGINDAPSDPTNYKVHPAFTFGEDKLTGFWYGKFEPSSKTECTAGFSVGTGCNVDTLIPQIKPNVTSWRGIRVSAEFTVSQKMITEHANEYGFNNNGSTDTHMSKNSEWGAVAYLSQSKYGKYGNSLYTGVYKEVYQNKSDSYLTGNSNGTPSQEASREEGQCAYNDMINLGEGKGFCGPGASTTGNITGVYDMSGGTWELVMGALADDEGKPRSGEDTKFNSGFNGLLADGTLFSTGRDLPEPKYYDSYTSTNPSSNDDSLNATACGGGICYGHALSETLRWYDDWTYFPSSQGSWIRRGGPNINGTVTGVFGIRAISGNAASDNTFRLVLVSIET